MAEFKRDLSYWSAEASYIELETSRFILFGRLELGDFNYDPACYRRYVVSHEELCRKDGFVDLADKIKTQIGRLDDHAK